MRMRGMKISAVGVRRRRVVKLSAVRERGMKIRAVGKRSFRPSRSKLKIWYRYLSMAKDPLPGIDMIVFVLDGDLLGHE
jgi:hypothetical protein